MRLLLFDLDGTLIRSAGAGRRAMEQAWAAVFGRTVTLEPRWTAGRTDLAIFREMARRSGLEAEMERHRDRLVACYLEALERELARGAGEVLPGVVELLGWARASGWALALGTGNLEAGARRKLEPFDLNGYFPVGGFAEDGEDRRTLLEAAVRRAAAQWGECARCVVVVGDTPLDVEAAHAAGYQAVAVATGPYGVEELAATGAEAVLPALAPRERAVRELERVAAQAAARGLEPEEAARGSSRRRTGGGEGPSACDGH